MDNEGEWYHWTRDNKESKKKELELMGNDEMEWNKSTGMELDKSVIEVDERNDGMVIDGNEWIENMDANENEKQRWVVMKVMEVKKDGKEDWIMNSSVW